MMRRARHGFGVGRTILGVAATTLGALELLATALGPTDVGAERCTKDHDLTTIVKEIPGGEDYKVIRWAPLSNKDKLFLYVLARPDGPQFSIFARQEMLEAPSAMTRPQHVAAQIKERYDDPARTCGDIDIKPVKDPSARTIGYVIAPKKVKYTVEPPGIFKRDYSRREVRLSDEDELQGGGAGSGGMGSGGTY